MANSTAPPAASTMDLDNSSMAESWPAAAGAKI
jgi:hypothetical protein